VIGEGTLATTHDGPEVKQWARMRDDANAPLRRGAWCRVLGTRADQVILDAGGRQLIVDRSSLILSSARPERWSVVARPNNAVNVPPQWGLQYCVCPGCSHRAALGIPMPRKRCSRCGETFPLADEQP
jgi:hypothetical protein